MEGDFSGFEPVACEYIQDWIDSKRDVLTELAGLGSEDLSSDVDGKILVEYSCFDRWLDVYKEVDSEKINVGSIKNPLYEFAESSGLFAGCASDTDRPIRLDIPPYISGQSVTEVNYPVPEIFERKPSMPYKSPLVLAEMVKSMQREIVKYRIDIKGKVSDSGIMNRDFFENWINSKSADIANLAGAENEYLPSNVKERINVKYRGPGRLMHVYKKSGSKEEKIGSIENPFQEITRYGVDPIMKGNTCIGLDVSELSGIEKDSIFYPVISYRSQGCN